VFIPSNDPFPELRAEVLAFKLDLDGVSISAWELHLNPDN
jgi:hypothetical protein